MIAQNSSQVITHIGGMQLDFLNDIASGPNKELILLDHGNKLIVVFDDRLNLLKVFGQGSGDSRLDYPYSVAVTNDLISVSDCGSHQVKRYSLQGELLSVFGCYGHEVGNFKYPRGLVFTNNKLLYVVDGENHRIQAFQQDGTFAFAFGSRGISPGQFQRPCKINVDNNKNVLVTDYDANCIHIFNCEGHFIQKINCYHPFAIILSPTGYLITSHGGCSNKIKVWSLSYQLMYQFGKKGPKQREYDNICGIALSSTGILYIVERYNKRIKVLRSN